MSRTDAHRPKRVIQHFALVKHGHIDDGATVPGTFEWSKRDDKSYLLTDQQMFESGLVQAHEDERWERCWLLEHKAQLFPTVESELADMEEYTWADYLAENREVALSFEDQYYRPARFSGSYTLGEPISRGYLPDQRELERKLEQNRLRERKEAERKQAELRAQIAANEPAKEREQSIASMMTEIPSRSGGFRSNRAHKVA